MLRDHTQVGSSPIRGYETECALPKPGDWTPQPATGIQGF